MRPPRFRLWQMMIAIALIATLAFAEKMRRQRAICRARAVYYATREQECRDYVPRFRAVLGHAQARLEAVRKEQRDCSNPLLRQLYIDEVEDKERLVARCTEDVRKAEEELQEVSRLHVEWELAASRPWLERPPEQHRVEVE